MGLSRAKTQRLTGLTKELLDEEGEGLVLGMGDTGEESSFHDGSQTQPNETKVNIRKG